MVSLEARSGASLVAPTSGTFTLRSPAGVVIVTGAVTIVASVATFTVAAGDLPSTLAYGSGYVEEWDLLIGGVTHYPRRDAYLARRALHCPVTQEDLLGSNPELLRQLGSAASSFDGWRDEVWADALNKLRGGGLWPEQIVEVSSLAPYIRYQTLYRVFLNLSVSAPDRYTAVMAEHKAMAAEAWREIKFTTDADQDGTPDDPSVLRGPQQGVILRGSAPRGYSSRLGRVLG